MQTPVRNLLLLGYAATAHAMATLGSGDVRAAALCGALGVLNVDPAQLPEGVSSTDLRMCSEHPNGDVRVLDPARGASLAPGGLHVPSNSTLSERSCYYAAPFGCSSGYCWKTCEQNGHGKPNGKWCWTASKSGFGHWNKCSTYAECGTNVISHGCGRGCVVSRSCGCSC